MARAGGAKKQAVYDDERRLGVWNFNLGNFHARIDSVRPTEQLERYVPHKNLRFYQNRL